MISPYTILEIEETATEEEIKKSYKKLCLKYHPDKNNNSLESVEKFKEINNAYEIIKNNNFLPPSRQVFHNISTIHEQIFRHMQNMQNMQNMTHQTIVINQTENGGGFIRINIPQNSNESNVFSFVFN